MPLQAGFFGKERSRADSYTANCAEVPPYECKARASRNEHRYRMESAFARSMPVPIKGNVFQAVGQSRRRRPPREGHRGWPRWWPGSSPVPLQSARPLRGRHRRLWRDRRFPSQERLCRLCTSWGKSFLDHPPTALVFPLAFRLVAGIMHRTKADMAEPFDWRQARLALHQIDFGRNIPRLAVLGSGATRASHLRRGRLGFVGL